MKQLSCHALRAPVWGFAGALAVLLSSCDSGARVSASGAGPVSPGASGLVLDYDLRRDILLDSSTQGFLGDARAADIDGDGLTDLVESDFVSRQISFGQGDGLGNFTPADSYKTPGLPHKIALGDYDGDGDTDIAVLCKNQDIGQTVELKNSVALFLQNGSSVFSLASVFELTPPGATPDIYDPFDMTAAPLRGGADELVVTLPGPRHVKWLAFEGGELVEVQTLVSDARPLTVAAADMNGDGAPDIVLGEDQVADSSLGRVSYFPVVPDTGESVLFAAAGVPPGNPIRVPGVLVSVPVVSAMGDTDGDGVGEIGVADFGGRFLTVFQAGEEGTFDVLHSIDFEDGIFAALAADLDADGITDFAASLVDQGAMAIARGSETGFEALEHYNVGYLPRAVAAIELRDPGAEDAVIDLVTCNADDLSLLEGRRVESAGGESGSSYRAARGYRATEGFEPRLLRAAPLDADETVDVVAIDRLQRKLVFFAGDGEGGLEFAGSTQLEETLTETPGYLVVEDLDGDGDLDLATSVIESDEVAIFLNQGTLPFQNQVRIPVGDEPRGLDVGDVDGDGDPDLMIANHAARTLEVCLGDGEGGFEPGPTVPMSLAPLAVMLADFDGDEVLDCLVTTGTPNENDAVLLVYAGNGDGTFDAEAVSQRPLEAQSLDLGLGDFDDNGLLDVAASQAGESSTSVYVFLNDGDFAFTEREISLGDERAGPGTIEVVDADRDGNLDLLVPLSIGELQVALGRGDGSFELLSPEARARDMSVPFGTQSSAYADMDGDGLEELVLCSSRTSHVWVARNTSTLLLLTQ